MPTCKWHTEADELPFDDGLDYCPDCERGDDCLCDGDYECQGHFDNLQ